MADETAATPPKTKKPRKRKTEPTPEQLAERQAQKSWTSWKLDTQRAIIADKRLPATDVRLLLFLLHQMNRDTGVAIVHDSRIRDEVHGYAVDTTIYRTRKRLREIGWLQYVPGSGLNASRYWVVADNVEGVMSRVRKLAEDRREVQERRKALRKSGEESLHSQHKQERAKRRKPKGAPLHIATQVSVTDAWLSPSLSPSGSQGATGTNQDVALLIVAVTPQAEVMSCPDCGTIAEAGAKPGSRCAECEAKALRLEFEVRELPQSEAGSFVCVDCGGEAELAARYKSEPYCPFCRDCVVEAEFPDVKRFAAPRSYAEASRGR